MNTDSEALMQQGIATGQSAFELFQRKLSLSAAQIDKTFCHQVGGTHRKLMLDSLSIDASRDYPTLHWLGNTGSAALPSAMAIGLQSEFAASGDRIAMLGIGSGINSIMIGVRWNRTLVKGSLESGLPFETQAIPNISEHAMI
jgi:acyl-CoA:acyl-CoA alkyltransferase